MACTLIAPPLTRASSLTGYVDWFTKIGAPVDSGLQRALLPVSFRERPDAWLSYRQARAFVADMAYREGVCDRGLPITDMARVFNRKLIDPVLGAADLGNAIRQVCITCRAQNSGVRFWLEPNEDMVRLCLLLPLGNNFPGHTISEARTLQLINQLLSEFAGPVFRPSVVQLTSTRHDLLFDPGTVFGDLPVHTGQQRSALVFPRKLLFAQGISARQRAETMPESDACSRMPPAPIGATIDALLEPYLSEGYPHINLAASLMGCSVRTLQRRLTQEGTSYSALIDGVRARAATGRLSQGNCDLPALATSLGYSEHAAFSRAFRRWTGTTPARFRSDHKD
jgi:AraC-like DNA-binding protein